MGLRGLTVVQMLGYTGALLDPAQPTRALLLATPATKGLVAGLDDAHHALTTTQQKGAPAALTERLSEVQGEEVDVDGTHDDFARGVHGVLTGLADIARAIGDAPRVNELLDLRAALYPRGLKVVSDSYADESVEGKRLDATLTDDQRAALKKLKTLDKRTLLDDVTGRLDAAESLGKLEVEKDSIQKQIASSAEVVAASDVLAERTHWIRTVRALESVVRAERAPIAGLVAGVLDPLDKLEAAAERKAKAKKKPAPPPPVAPPGGALPGDPPAGG